MISKLFTALALVLCLSVAHAQVGIGTATPNETSLLDMQSNSKGLLIPRMTVAERDAIVTPADGLQIYNTTNNTLDVYSGSAWKSFAYSDSPNLVYVYSIDDLPTPTGGAISLDGTKMYVFSGTVDISPNYILMNGAGLRGTDPQKDKVKSNVVGAVLQSVNTSVFIENLAVVPASSSTSAYDFSDTSGFNFCNVFSGSGVIEDGTSLGVGQISGFKAITFVKNYWNVTDGLKITGNVGKFTAAYCFIEGVTSGSGLEFLPGLTIDDIDLSNNYFIYTGETGIKVDAGATVDRGRVTTNMFRGVTTPLAGIDSYAAGWSMQQNTNIPNSRGFSYIYFNGNTTATTFSGIGSFSKIAGTTTVINEKRFTATGANNKITYNDVVPIVADVTVIISAKAPENGSEYSIAIAKNGIVITTPIASMGSATNNQAFQISLNMEVDLVTGDYLEVFIKNNTTATSILVNDLQFRVTD